MPGDGGDSSTWAILVAAGSGERLGADRPKAFVALGGRVLLAESLERLDASDWIDAVVVAVPADWEEAAIVLAEELVASKVAAVVTGGATRAESVRAALEEIPDDALVVDRARRRPAARRRRRDRARARAARRGLSTASCRASRSPTRSSASKRGVVAETVDRSALVTVQTPQAFTATALRARLPRRRAGRRDRLRVARGGARWPDPRRRRRPPAAEDHDGGRPRARRVVALKAVFFDVGETLVDEERWWRVLAERSGLQPHVVWAALGVTIERGEDHNELWGHLGIERPTEVVSTTSRTSSTTCTRTRSRASNRSRRSACGSGSSGTSPQRWSAGRATPALPADVISSSASLGVKKPDPRFFERIVELAGCDAGEVAYVGDRVDNDVVPPPRRGSSRSTSGAGPWGRLQRTPPEADPRPRRPRLAAARR